MPSSCRSLTSTVKRKMPCETGMLMSNRVWVASPPATLRTTLLVTLLAALRTTLRAHPTEWATRSQEVHHHHHPHRVATTRCSRVVTRLLKVSPPRVLLPSHLRPWLQTLSFHHTSHPPTRVAWLTLLCRSPCHNRSSQDTVLRGIQEVHHHRHLRPPDRQLRASLTRLVIPSRTPRAQPPGEP